MSLYAQQRRAAYRTLKSYVSTLKRRKKDEAVTLANLSGESAAGTPNESLLPSLTARSYPASAADGEPPAERKRPGDANQIISLRLQVAGERVATLLSPPSASVLALDRLGSASACSRRHRLRPSSLFFLLLLRLLCQSVLSLLRWETSPPLPQSSPHPFHIVPA